MSITPGQFMASTPRSTESNSDWGSRYGRELRGVITRQAGFAPRSRQVHLGPSEMGAECLSGDTEVVTRTGLRRIADLATEGEAELLVPLLYAGSDIRKRWGRFQRVPVACFGEQELLRVTLRRNQEKKVVHATADHHWFRSYWSGKNKKQVRLATTELKRGYKLTQLRHAMPRSTTLMPVAVAQGFIFGDGTKGNDCGGKHRAATLSLYHNGKDEAMLQFFPGEHKQYQDSAHKHAYSLIRNLPRFWKKLPPIEESCSFLASWLAGYFAADGCVTEDGHCSISSANQAHLEFVRDLAAVCGIGYGQIKRQMRVGISGDKPALEATPLYVLSLRRRDLPPWFFLQNQHRERAETANAATERDPHWIVESVELTGRMDPVYCATVDGIGAFGLADDLMTGNCDRQVVGKMAGVPRTNHVSDPWPSIIGTATHGWLAEAFRDENYREGLLRWLTETKVAPHPDYPGSADLYDAQEFAVIDHKVLGQTSLARIKSAAGPPVRYQVQLLLYAQGFRLAGLPVKRVVLAAYPRTAATLDGMYIWDHPCTPADDVIIRDVLERTAARREVAGLLTAGLISLHDVPATPSDESCFWCPLYRPQSSYDGGPGCPGTVTPKAL